MKFEVRQAENGELEYTIPVKVGDVVNYHKVKGGPVTSTGHVIKSIQMMWGRPCIWMTGKAGCISLDSISRVEESKDEGN